MTGIPTAIPKAHVQVPMLHPKTTLYLNMSQIETKPDEKQKFEFTYQQGDKFDDISRYSMKKMVDDQIHILERKIEELKEFRLECNIERIHECTEEEHLSKIRRGTA